LSTEGHKHYKFNYLTNVIFRIDFPSMDFNTSNPPREFIKSLKETFPKYAQIKGQSVELKIKDFKHSTNIENVVSWELKDPKNQKRVVINSDSLVLENLKYSGFEDFNKDINFIIKEFGKNYPLNRINSMGLRFINQIDLKPPKKPLNWKTYIKPELTSVLDKFVVDTTNISRSLQFLEFNEEDYRLRFQFGMFNSEYPNVISKKEFLLDYDCVTVGELSFNDILSTAGKFHEIIYDLYEASIDDELRELMKDE
jgi:uncharacterized protein (TIGR04255 family)